MVTPKFADNAFLWLLAGSAVTALVAGLNANSESKSFFVAIRVVVCFASAYAGVRAYRAKRETLGWLLGANAALYNPFVLVHLTRSTWKLVDLADIVLVAAAAFVLRVRADKLPLPGGGDGVSAPVVKSERLYRTSSWPKTAIWLVLLALSMGGALLFKFSVPNGAAEVGNQARAHVLGAGGQARASDMNTILAQVGRFDPPLEARLRAGTTPTVAPSSAIMSSSLLRALQRAPDAAVLAFAHKFYDIVPGNSSAHKGRCAAVFNANRADLKLSSQEELEMLRALGDLYSAAAEMPATREDAEQTADTADLTALHKQFVDEVLVNENKKFNELPHEEQCALYEWLMKLVWTMTPRDAATTVRAMFAP